MSLTQVWSEIERMLDDKLSIIPVRDKDEEVNGKTFYAKSPYGISWKQYQRSIISRDFLWYEMQKHDTEAIAIVCGRISGNLEVIDIDEKYKPGISAIIFQDLLIMFPDLFKKLRIHKSPSGGHHILYRLANTTPARSHKMCSRPTTDLEKSEFREKHPENTKDLLTVSFIEMKAEGGYVLAPPSLNYSIVQDVTIPLLTESERSSIYNICLNYNEIKKEPKPFETPKDKINYYDENPYNHFSRTVEPIAFMEQFGWKYTSKRGEYTWFTRPGKSGGVSGSFNHNTRIFWSFSASTDIESYKGFFLASILIDEKFGGDKKLAYQWLVENGYGKINRKHEQRQLTKFAATGEDIPENFSEEARKGYEQLVNDLKEQHPHGIFWEQMDDSIVVSRKRLYEVSEAMGYRVYDTKLCKIINNFVYEADLRDYFDEMKNYIKIEDENLHEDIINAYETFIEKHGKFTTERLKLLTDEDIMFDTKNECYKFYQDKWVKITAAGIEQMEYSELNKLVLDTRVQKRILRMQDGGKYIEYLNKACELEANKDYIQKIVGYYAHEYNDETMGFMVILTEKCSDPKDGGRSGKNLFVKLLKYTTSIIDKAGSQTKFDDKVFQIWNGERVFSISDLPEGFDLSYFKNISTGGFVEWKLHTNHKVIPIEKSFKLIFSTNYSYNCSDGGLNQRVIPLEFTDFFKHANGVDTYFGGRFPDSWSDADWAGYDSFVLSSIKCWLQSGGKLKGKDLSNSGWEKQFNINNKVTTTTIIKTFWEKWVAKQFVSTEDFNQDLNQYYADNMTPFNMRPSMQKINIALKDYADHLGVEFKKDYIQSGIKGRLFLREDLPF